MISGLRAGGVIVVWRIDLLGRPTYELIKLMVEWKELGGGGVFLRELILSQSWVGCSTCSVLYSPRMKVRFYWNGRWLAWSRHVLEVGSEEDPTG